ncbi:MAG: DNA internalization-related competence protein ComEC/Rec2 [Myxococcales bacterium]|nr:DNA internalization-related competence protein ComEC/Rec2 [Myxococcales bacterium]
MPHLPFAPLPAALAFAAGIALAPLVPGSGDGATRWLIAALLALAALARSSPRLAAVAVLAAGFARGAPVRSELPIGTRADDRIEDRIAGTVQGPVVRTRRGGSGARIGDVWVWSEHALVPGDRVAATGRIITERTGHVMNARAVERLGVDHGLRATAWRWAQATQAAGARRIAATGGAPAARAALSGITVGDRSDVPEALDARWRAAGIYHVLSVSGLHLAAIAGLAFTLLTALVAASPWGGRVHPARWAAPPALALAIAYTLVTGAQVATVRALIVIALWLVAQMLARPLRLVDALGAAALLLLAWSPEDLADPAFQLSFVAALTLAAIPAAPEPLGARRSRVRRWLVRGLVTSVWVSVATAPITAFHFQQVSAGGVIGNLVLTPLVELVALPLALVGLVLGELGDPLLRAAVALVELVDAGAGALATVVPVARAAVASAVVMAMLVALSAWLASRSGRRTRADLALWLALCVAWSMARTPPAPGALRVTFLDVGQGDAALVELPDGAVWLIDAGPNGGRAITTAVLARGHDAIDLAIVSHPHPDHFGGLGQLGVPVRELWAVREVEATREGAAFAGVARATGAPLTFPPLGVAREQAGVRLTVLAPSHAGQQAADPVRSVNDNSLVLELAYAGRRILFAGDVEHEGEDVVVPLLGPADVVKVPHHGSPTSSSAPFVAATAPRLAVISCGRGNRFGFPSPAVVARWRDAGAAVARTDEGSVTVVIDAGGALAVP